MATDLNDIEAACEARAWLLEDLTTAKIPFDDFQHASNCNVSPIYQKEKSLDERRTLNLRGCDQHCIDRWLEKKGLVRAWKK